MADHVSCRAAPVARSAAMALALFTALNAIGEWLIRGFDANIWWIDLRPLPRWAADAMLLALSALLAAWAIAPRPSGWRRRWTVAALALFALLSLLNASAHYLLLFTGRIDSSAGVPLSLLVLLLIMAIAWRVIRPGRSVTALRFVASAGLALGTCAIGFPLAQMWCFGQTDYRRPVDAVVVFGARAYADGRPSHALADRVRTGCELYREGLVKKVIFSGGPGDGAVHETEAMRRMALELGVADEDILLDAGGVNTSATVTNTAEIFQRHSIRRVLVVSHFYHLPRIKMTYQRQGIEVWTVPARQRYFLRQTPYLLMREVAALWAYYLSPFAPGLAAN